MIPTTKIEQLVKKHHSLEKELSSSNLDKKDFATKSKEYSSLGEIIQCAHKYLNFENLDTYSHSLTDGSTDYGSGLAKKDYDHKTANKSLVWFSSYLLFKISNLLT